MEITETITRECCQQNDLMPYNGVDKTKFNFPKFCKYCGQLFQLEVEFDDIGDKSCDYRRVYYEKI